ncbi:MAG TPA: hypothetical protein VKV39_15655 [Candidatus Sulfotelmatobacter sp.]|nr:hypothetical protein [Candidatus Sulfotelmatobacter sp.]
MTHPQPWWHRLRPRFTGANFAAYSALFVLGFVIWRFDFPLFRTRRMHGTDDSLILAALFACWAFFIDTTKKLAKPPRAEGAFDWPRFLQLAAGELVLGAVLYVVFIYTPTAVAVIFGFASWIVVEIDIFDPKRTHSLGSRLCVLTGIPSMFCLIAWRITDQDVWMIRMLVCCTLMAALTVLDRWEDVR